MDRQEYIDHADEPEKANPALDELNKYQAESTRVLFILTGTLLHERELYLPCRSQRGNDGTCVLVAMTRAEGPPVLPKIAAPTRVLWGAKDPVLKAEWRDRLGDYFSDLSVDVAPDAGHYPHWETPDAAAREILDFIAPRVAHGAWR